MRKPRVLVFSSLSPVPVRRGSQARLFHIVRHLREVAETRLVYLDRTWEPAGADMNGLEGIEVRSVPVGKRETAWKVAQSLALQRPASVFRYCNARTAEFARRQIAEFQPDIFWGYLQDASLFYPPDRSVRRVLDFVDCLTLHYDTLRAHSDGSLRAGLVSRIQPHLKEHEREALLCTDYAIVSSQRNQDQLGQYDLETPVQVLYTVVPDRFFARRWDPQGAVPGKMLFVGNFSYSANISGVRYAIEHILPLVRLRIPDAELTVVGPEQERLAEQYRQTPGVRFKGYVDDLVSEYLSASILLVPVPYATGIQTKLVEAMAVGLPAVVSVAALAANEVQDKRHVLAADRPEAYAEAVVTLLRDTRQAAEISDAGRILVTERHSESAHKRQIAKIIDEVTGAAVPTP